MTDAESEARIRDEDAERWAFEMFATAYPHEAHATWPDRFWEFFRRVRPGVSREEMVQLLETES